MSYIFKNEDHFGFGLVRDLIKSIRFVQSRVEKFSYPCLVIQGAKDVVVNYHDISSVFKSIPAPDKTIRIMEEGFHEIYVDKEKDRVAETIIEWLNFRTDNAIDLGEIKFIKVNVGKRKRMLVNSKNTTLFLVYCLIIRMYAILLSKRLLRLKEYKESRFKLFFFPLFWAFQIIKVIFSKNIKKYLGFAKSFISEIGISN